MFARSTCKAFRAAAPLRSGIRGYASEGSSGGSAGGGSSRLLGYGTIAIATAGLGYWYNQNYRSTGATSTTPLQPGDKVFKGGDQGFISLKLEDIENLSHNAKKLRFAFPESNDVSGLSIASAVITKYQGPEMQKPVIRPYTPVSDEDTMGHMDFIIKKYPNGPMSEHIHSLNPGQRLDIKGPIPKYQIDENRHDHIGMVAGGTGITPMYQVIRNVFKNSNDKTKITLVYGNVTEEDILLKKELQELENTYPRRFRVFYTLDKPPEGWAQGKGFITKDVLKQVLPEPKSENIKIFVCGPPGLYKAISGTKNSPQDQGELTGILKDLGYSKDQVFKF